VEGLQDKVIIVAGSASGIGAATARKLAKYGAKLVLADIKEEEAATVAASIVEAGGIASSIRFDILDESTIAGLVAYTLDLHGRIDGLHNNVADVALTVRDTNLIDIELDVWERTLRVNLTGLFLTMRYVVPEMLKQGGGSIVNTSSAAAFSGEAEIPAYASSKAGLLALTRHVASAYGRRGIRCNAVAPGAIATEGAVAAILNMGGKVEERYQHMRENVTRSHRDGKSEDIAMMVALLLSDGGSWINGQCYGVDGGWLLR